MNTLDLTLGRILGRKRSKNLLAAGGSNGYHTYCRTLKAVKMQFNATYAVRAY